MKKPTMNKVVREWRRLSKKKEMVDLEPLIEMLHQAMCQEYSLTYEQAEYVHAQALVTAIFTRNSSGKYSYQNHTFEDLCDICYVLCEFLKKFPKAEEDGQFNKERRKS